MADVMSLVFLSIFLLVLLPIPRAWLLALCGKYAAATEIYENQLARRPHHLPLYLTLANLYLLAGRHDERALVAYRVVLQVRLATHHLQALKNSDMKPPRNLIERMTVVQNLWKKGFSQTKTSPVSASARD